MRDAILALEDDKDRARLAALFGDMTTPRRDLGEVRAVLRLIGQLDDADLERLAKWFSTWMSRWGQMPRATGMQIEPNVRRDPPSGG